MSRVPYKFERVLGSCRDVNELEYLACIHQTCGAESRVDASIVSNDVKRLLISRHGLKIEKKEIEEHVLIDLIGTPDRVPDPVMDLRQMMALLLIPQLVSTSAEEGNARGSQEYDADAPSIFETVLRIIIEDSGVDTGEEEFPILTVGVLRKIFSTYGENDVDEDLIEKMIERADVYHSDGPIMLDPEVFQRVLTSDVKLYKPKWEGMLTTHFDDVRTAQSERHRRAALFSLTDPQNSFSPNATRRSPKSSVYTTELKRVFTFPMIDMDADTFESQAFYVILVVAIVCFYVGYYNILLPSKYFVCGGSVFACITLNTLLDWMAILLQLSISGTALIILVSLSNHSYHQKNWTTFCKLIGTTAILPIMAILTTADLDYLVYKKEADAVKWAQFGTFFTGIILVAMQCGQLVSIFLPDMNMITLKFKPLAIFFFSSGFQERDTKKAAAIKVGQMVQNALALHEKEGDDDDGVRFDHQGENTEEHLVKRTPSAMANDRFSDLALRKETVGGFVWVWKQFFSREWSEREGIFFGARFIGCNVAQWLVLVAFISLIIIAVSRIGNTGQAEVISARGLYYNTSGSFLYNMSSATETFIQQNDLTFGYIFDDLNSTYTSSSSSLLMRRMLEAVENLPGTVAFIFEEALRQKAADYAANTVQSMTGVDPRMPLAEPLRFQTALSGDFLLVTATELGTRAETIEIVAGLAVGGVFGALAIAIIALNHLPSYVINVLRFRSGSLGSLRDSRFVYLTQVNPFFTSLLLGSSFWGTAMSGAATGLVFGSVVFLSIWEETQKTMWRILAIVIVLSLTWLIRVGIVFLIYSSVSKTFLRNKPAASNIALLMFEAWNMGNALSYVLVRALRVLVIALFYLGRLDVWVLADGVGEFWCMHPDAYPRAFNRDLLVHEAHRHPYAERLSVMYMLKLRFKNQFGNRTGGCWRLLFVSALMPWMVRYRVNRLPEGMSRAVPLSSDESPFNDTARVKEEKDAPSSLAATRARSLGSGRITQSHRSVELQLSPNEYMGELSQEINISDDGLLLDDDELETGGSPQSLNSHRRHSEGVYSSDDHI